MANQEEKIKPQAEDKKPTISFPIFYGFDQEVVFIAQYNPDQMARTLAETFNTQFFTDSETDDQTHSPWPGLKAAKITTQQQQRRRRVLKTKSKLSKDLTKEQLLALYELYDHKVFCEAASAYIEENLWQEVEKFYEKFIERAMAHAFQGLIETAEQRGLKKPSQKEKEAVSGRWQQMKRIRFGLPNAYRPKGREDFQNCKDFLTALKKALSNEDREPKPPTRRKLLYKLRQDKLYRGKKKDMPTRNEAQTLDNWLKDCDIENYEEAIELYWKRP